MLNNILAIRPEIMITMAAGCAFALTALMIALLKDRLPRDGGRDFAVDGKLSQGKPRGAGIIFVSCYIAVALLFGRITAELLIYLGMLFVCMMTGYLDDRSETPWGEYKKAILDMLVSIVIAVTYLYFNPNTARFVMLGTTIELPKLLYGILIIILVWVAVNVTNCADGVDGLSGSLTITTLVSVYLLYQRLGDKDSYGGLILMFIAVLLAYLWFNATPSVLMMGDAGSRAMGLFIALMILKTGAPFMYILLSLVLILDGGLGLIKVSLIRFLKIKIWMNIRFPLHDQVRKNMGWSNTQCVYRFVIVQIVISALTLGLVR